MAVLEEQYRLAAFKWIEEQVQIHGEVLPRSILEKGFILNSQQVTLVGPSGIWKPKVLEKVPLSITTVAGGPYDDVFTKDGFLEYRYRGTDINHRDNVGLREAMVRQIPLIYFHGIVKSKYLAVWPVFVIGDNPKALSFTLAADEQMSIGQYLNSLNSSQGSLVADESAYYKRSYITSTIKTRLHQKSFRERVLEAYHQQCTFCRLRHIELLDAAHIIPDSEVYGESNVNNGLSLCKIHHAAFDSNIIGVTPEYKIEVRKDILLEKDGPMLLYGIQQFHDKRIILPSSRTLWPDQEKLEMRYDRFIKAG
ncbi:MAG: HNH endonuclease [Syntrophomonadaceae bacterium]|nr:HNH endonuclease [Syntrophomonadaceae bacterium]